MPPPPPPPKAEQTKDGKDDAIAVSDDDLTDGSAIEKLEKRAVDKADKDMETLGKLVKEGNDTVDHLLAQISVLQSKKRDAAVIDDDKVGPPRKAPKLNHYKTKHVVICSVGEEPMFQGMTDDQRIRQAIEKITSCLASMH